MYLKEDLASLAMAVGRSAMETLLPTVIGVLLLSSAAFGAVQSVTCSGGPQTFTLSEPTSIPPTEDSLIISCANYQFANPLTLVDFFQAGQLNNPLFVSDTAVLANIPAIPGVSPPFLTVTFTSDSEATLPPTNPIDAAVEEPNQFTITATSTTGGPPLRFTLASDLNTPTPTSDFVSIAVVPEPSSLVLLGIGFAVLGGALRRRVRL